MLVIQVDICINICQNTFKFALKMCALCLKCKQIKDVNRSTIISFCYFTFLKKSQVVYVYF